MKKAWLVVLLVAVLYTVFVIVPFAGGCHIYYMNLNGEEDEIWLADDIDFYMMWDADKSAVLGAAIVDGERIDLDIGWSGGFMANEVAVFPYPYPKEAFVHDVLLMEGLIKKNGKDKYILTISEADQQYNKLFPGYDTISITKYAESEIEWVDGWPVPIEG